LLQWCFCFIVVVQMAKGKNYECQKIIATARILTNRLQRCLLLFGSIINRQEVGPFQPDVKMTVFFCCRWFQT
jgi:hypothetical protein